MRIVLDMNLTPDWIPALAALEHEVVHWSSVGSPRASDREILGWARKKGYVVFTHDLDFGTILAATEADAPSVIQIRTADPTPAHCLGLIQEALKRFESELEAGALLSIDEERSRIRLFPLRNERRAR